MFSLIDMNYSTRFCKFSVDSVNDLPSLPTKTSKGKGILSTIHSCSQGSMAYSILCIMFCQGIYSDTTTNHAVVFSYFIPNSKGTYMGKIGDTNIGQVSVKDDLLVIIGSASYYVLVYGFK